jgi:hypothetical protein
MKGLKLPGAPAHQTGPVKAWAEPVVIPTYHPLPPDKNPMFLEKRVYQQRAASSTIKRLSRLSAKVNGS